MVNILLTSKCNRSCPYCFAEQEMSGQKEDWLSWQDLLYVADFLWSNGRRQVSLLGGEPTIHPRCVDFIRYLLDRGFNVSLFSNGVLSNKRLEEFKTYLEAVSPDRFNIVCNLNNPLQTPMNAKDDSRIDEFLSLMGPFVTPGFNIYRRDFDLDFIFDAIMKYGMRRDLRVGVAHPVIGATNTHIHSLEIKAVIKRLLSYRPSLETYRVRLSLDCGFPLCAFSDEELGWLRRWANPASFSCSPAIDIAPDMSVYYCFPLSQYERKSLFDFDTMDEIEAYFSRVRHEIRSEVAGIYDACDGCLHYDNAVCGAGGICHVIGRFVDEAPIRLTGIENEIAKFRLPAR
jgi:Radical SAM superfamily/4Fe-4S single cluster domain